MEKIYLVILLIIIYLIYRDFLQDFSRQKNENFENITLGSADDQNAINLLAQMAKDLMAGGATVPGTLGFGSKDATGFRLTNEGGNGWACLRANNGDSSFCMHNTHGSGTRLNPGGDVTIKGRNILAELDKLNSRWNGDNLIVPGHLTVNNGSNFSGGRHYFKDEENTGRVRVGGVYGKPGIWGQDTGGLLQVSNFEIGSQRAGDNNTGGMIEDKWYDFIRSRNPSYGLLGPSNTGQLGMAWNNGRMYWTFLEKNQRWNSDYGNLAN